MTIGERIYLARIRRKMTRWQLSKHIPTGYPNIKRWEADIVSPTWVTLEKIARALGISMQDLLWPSPAGGLGPPIHPENMKYLRDAVEKTCPTEIFHALETLLGCMVEWIDLETGRDKPVLQQAFALGRRFEREASE